MSMPNLARTLPPLTIATGRPREWNVVDHNAVASLAGSSGNGSNTIPSSSSILRRYRSEDTHRPLSRGHYFASRDPTYSTNATTLVNGDSSRHIVDWRESAAISSNSESPSSCRAELLSEPDAEHDLRRQDDNQRSYVNIHRPHDGYRPLGDVNGASAHSDPYDDDVRMSEHFEDDLDARKHDYQRQLYGGNRQSPVTMRQVTFAGATSQEQSDRSSVADKILATPPRASAVLNRSQTLPSIGEFASILRSSSPERPCEPPPHRPPYPSPQSIPTDVNFARRQPPPSPSPTSPHYRLYQTQSAPEHVTHHYHHYADQSPHYHYQHHPHEQESSNYPQLSPLSPLQRVNMHPNQLVEQHYAILPQVNPGMTPNSNGRIVTRYEGLVDVGGTLFHRYEGGMHLPAEVDGGAVNPEHGLTRAGMPRKRSSGACGRCRKKKVRCVAGHWGCVECAKAGKHCD